MLRRNSILFRICKDFFIIYYIHTHIKANRLELSITLSFLNSANVSTMIPNTIFRPMRLTMMKKVKSKKTDLNAAFLKFIGKLVA